MAALASEELPNSQCPIGIAGAGRMGQTLGRLLAQAGEPVVAVASRNPAHASEGAAFVGSRIRATSLHDLPRLASRVLITVSDDAVPSVAATLADGGLKDGVALHTCGAFGPEALRLLAEQGVACGVIHPLQTVATPEQGLAALRGIAFGIDGNGTALVWAREIVKLLEGDALRVTPEHRGVYHAAAVIAGNSVFGAVDAAVRLMEETGAGRDVALRALSPLVRASARNAVSIGPAKALTGPIARGDVGTVRSHLTALEKSPQAIADLYQAMGLYLLDMTRRKQGTGDSLSELERMLTEGVKTNAGEAEENKRS